MSEGDHSTGESDRKVDSIHPVFPRFWDQFAFEWGMARYSYNVVSDFRFLQQLNDLSQKLLDYLELKSEDPDPENLEDQEDVEIYEYAKKKFIPLLKLLNFWMYRCLDVTITNPSNGIREDRKIGFYHLRRQNMMPYGIEIYVIAVGFTVPISNQVFSEFRSYALYGEPDENGRQVGGTRSVANKIEAIFHLILEIKNVQSMPELKSGGNVMIGDEKEIKDVAKSSQLKKVVEEKRNESDRNS